MENQKLNILSLDGGGVRGLSTLFILKEIMETIDRNDPPKPCNYFDMIGGSGSGALIAIMLGRLKMDVDHCINAYSRLMKQAFSRRKLFSLGIGRQPHAKYDSKNLDKALKTMLFDQGYKDDTLFREAEHSCKVVVCIDDDERDEVIPLTNYQSKHGYYGSYGSATIFDAARASMARPSCFTPIRFGVSIEHFYDGSRRASNPIKHLWSEAEIEWSSAPMECQLGCVISIGTGIPSIITATGKVGLPDKTSIHAERSADEFTRQHTELDDENRLFRFNVPNGIASIGSDKVNQLSTIAQATQNHLSQEVIHKQIKRCAKSLGERGQFDYFARTSPNEPYSPAPVFPLFTQWISHENLKIDTIVHDQGRPSYDSEQTLFHETHVEKHHKHTKKSIFTTMWYLVKK